MCESLRLSVDIFPSKYINGQSLWTVFCIYSKRKCLTTQQMVYEYGGDE